MRFGSWLVSLGVCGAQLACGPDVVLGEHSPEATRGAGPAPRPQTPPEHGSVREPDNVGPPISFPRFDAPAPRGDDDLPIDPLNPRASGAGVSEDPNGPEFNSSDDFRPGDAGLEAEREVSGQGFGEFAQAGGAGVGSE